MSFKVLYSVHLVFYSFNLKKFIFYYTVLHAAIAKENAEIVKLLLKQQEIDVNSIKILNLIVF